MSSLKTHKLSNFLFLILLAVSLNGFGQSGVKINPYSQSILIGEQVRVDIHIIAVSDNPEIILPEFGDTITSNIEVINSLPLDTVFADSVLKNEIIGYRKQIVITSFDSGLWAFPELTVIIDSISFTTEAFLFEVNTVEVDTAEAFKQIIEPIELPMTFLEYVQAYYIYGVIAWGIMMALAILAFIFGKKHIQKSNIKIKEVIAPHIIALERLDQLKGEELWQSGAYKAFHIQVSDILREYIENRFHIPVKESTTDEIKHLLKVTRIDKTLRKEIIESLKVSDLVKFAKAIPEAEENEACLNTAYTIVDTTKIVEQPKPESTTNG